MYIFPLTIILFSISETFEKSQMSESFDVPAVCTDLLFIVSHIPEGNDTVTQSMFRNGIIKTCKVRNYHR